MLCDAGGPSDGSASASVVFTDSFYGRVDEVASTSKMFSSLDAEKQTTSDESAYRALEEELSRMSFRDACRKVSRLLSEAARMDGVHVESVIANADAQMSDKNVNNDITSARLHALRQAILSGVESSDGSHNSNNKNENSNRHQWTLRLARYAPLLWNSKKERERRMRLEIYERSQQLHTHSVPEVSPLK